MKIAGLQKTTLIDYPEKVACTIFLHGCNFRCGFCHNPELVIKENDKEISQEEVLEFLKKRVGQLDGVCITGGEPLLNIDEEFLRKIKSLSYDIKIDTNGSFPEKLEELLEKELVDFVAMDIKCSPEKYSKVTSFENIRDIEKSIKLITERAKDYEFRTTIVEDIHSLEEIKKLAEWLSGLVEKRIKKFVLQGFKNSGKFIDDSFKFKKDIEEKELIQLKEVFKEISEKVEIRV